MSTEKIVLVASLLLTTYFAAAETVSAPVAVATRDALACTSMARTELAPVEPPGWITQAKLEGAEAERRAFCDIQGYVNPSVGFAMRLPVDSWNGKFLQLGCGGFCGVLDASMCDPYLQRGYACAVSDNGHQGNGVDAAWAYQNLQAEVDHGFRATHVVALAAKAIVERYYGKAPRKSYFMGASTGGRQALMAAQRFPWDFDAIVAGVPSLPVPALHMSLLWGNRAITAGTGAPVVDQADLEFLHQAVIARCDLNDGVQDGLIGDPRRCNWNPAELRCNAGQTGRCLTSHQLEAVNKIYSGPVTSSGEQIYFPGAMKGSERGWLVWFGSHWIYEFVQQNFRYAAFDPDPGPSWKPEDFDFDRDYKRLGVAEALYTAGNPDLRRFKAAGGKLIVYHGWNDAGGMPLPTVDYYETVERIFGGRDATQEFFRLFVIPGMNHGPNEVDGAFETDWLAVLERWVEQGQAPEKVIIQHIKFEEGKPWPPRWPLDPSRIEYPRPVFPYPLLTHYSGRGDTRKAESFEAVEP